MIRFWAVPGSSCFGIRSCTVSLTIFWFEGVRSFSIVTITDHFSCISANLIYRITCTLCTKYIGETGRRLGDRYREHLRDVEINDKDASKPVARHFNLPNHSQKHMAVCGLSLHLGNTESRKNIEQKFIFQIGTLYPSTINECCSFL